MTNRQQTDHFDALIVGARCAGAATAMLLARAGMKVLVVDRDAAGTDTMSTHALMRGAVMQLTRWGLVDGLLAAGTPKVRKTTFHYGGQSLPLDIRPSHGVDFLLAPRRTVLDAALVASARAAGAEIRYETALRGLQRDPETGRVIGVELKSTSGRSYSVSADITIGADGRRSSVARMVEAPVRHLSRHQTGCVYAYVDGLPDDGFRWYYDANASAGAIPTNAGAHCVFAALPAEDFRKAREAVSRNDLLATLATRANRELGAMLAETEVATQPILFAGADGHMRQCTGPGWALVGDAGYFKDPLTAHGITDALRDAEILARAVVAGSDTALAGYQSDRDALSMDLFHVTDRIASFDWTLETLPRLHKRLNDAMKQEQTWMAQTFAPADLAA
ncbi:NAD(P)/FAD-dependent oxidoreductase [Tropicimonas sp. IMCC6043]|uniref:NAD(P)/FAD-dependent oxidoreductase n=1 Tax=Tropicimonas sp. IMCC6043 TaxID=2510645 RepID=UPI00101C888F|nr:NAD(P)/FAD-dependent oxidoreductase [Tropicimonas sp. IMCC6043]RYH11389.1 NAD(P)/FAD-dependent oxidoreductase [Tropicimonas sp. IMCC6043]